MTPSTPDRWSCRLIGIAVRLLPADRRQRYARELLAELSGMDRRQQRRHAVQVLAHAPALSAVLRTADPTTSQEDRMTMIKKPLKCRLGLHAWDERENPETHERYEICGRCDAYRDHPRAAPGTVAGSASINGVGL